MTHDKDEIWGTRGRRSLATGRPAHPIPLQVERGPGYAVGGPTEPADVTASAHGPEAYERAQTMAYERMTRIQQESPYAVEEVIEVEHVVHDYRLYVGMWIVAGIAAVCTFLTFSVPCLIITGTALLFALSATPGRQRRD